MKETPTKLKKKNVLPRLKVWLLQGKTITQLDALRLFRTTRLAEFIRQLRHDHGIDVKKRMIRANGSHYAEYYVERKGKQSKIKSQSYRDQSYPDWLRSL